MTFFMPYQSIIVIAVVITCFMLPNIPTSDGVNLPSPVIFFGWLDKRSEFRVGETATITMKFYVDFTPDQDKSLFDPHVSVQSIKGNSSFITGILSHLGDDLNKWRIMFVPIMVGAYSMIITEDHFKLMDHSLHYNALPGDIYEPGCIVSWMEPMNNFVAGTKATVLILPKDAFGNNVTSDSEGQKTYNFVVSATYDNGSNVNVVDVKFQGWNKFGYLSYEFVIVTAGRLSIHIKHQNESLINSPLPLKVHPGELDVGNCVARWRTEATSFQLSSRMETFIHQRDKYGNLVPGFHDFDIQVVNKGTKLSYPIVDLRSKEVSPGIQSFSFTTAEPGDFIMIISDETTKKQILNMPYEFHVFVGYCNGTASIVNGSGITGSRAGDVTKFSVYLRDTHGLSSPIELERLEVQITVPSLSLRVYPQIYPKVSVNDTQPPEMLSYGAFGHTGIASVPSFYSYNNSAENWQTRSSDFDVEYVPEKAEVHEILILCGNIPLNNGQPFLVVVNSGEPNLSMSKVVKYEPKVSTSIENYIIVQLVDSYSNPVSSRQEKLAVEIDSVKGTHSYPSGFMENYNGTYTGGYVMVDPCRYGISVSFNGARFSPFPLEVIAYNSDIFPKAQDDRLDVWEDQSIGFYALENDFFAGVYAKIVVLQKPSHGSILQYVNLLRYTPYKQYYGSDTFTYTFVDVYGINVSASVNIDVLIIPPQFVSIPRVLQATEDTLSPKIGGFQGFMLTYSDFQENFSVKFSAQHGAIFLSPFLMQLWDPMWNELSFSKEEGKVGNLYLTGRLEVINLAIQSLQYIGEENFYGNDNLTISTINTNGKYDFNVKIVVEPVNDAPFIDVPKFIILENEYEDGGFLIFDRQRDNLNFFVGDPDLLHFPGIETQFRVMFSVEVTSGYISAKLPAGLISTTELKFENSKHWQPLITFVQISRHFTVKAKGIRFQGTINDSNTLLHQLIYFRGKHAGVMRVRVNDMGWYGCYPDCAGMKIVPLEAEATINLISRMPINAVVAHSLGSVIVIESIILSSFALILMFFTCKCVIVLLREKKKQQVQSQDLQLAELKNSNEQRLSKDSSENMIHLADNSPIHLTQSEQPLNIPKQYIFGESERGTIICRG